MQSFISEHSAEYVLVPNLIRKLQQNYRVVIPIFYWATREGNNTALFSMQGTRVRVLTAYARRPRVHGSNVSIGLKINEGLYQYAVESEKMGMPVLAGIPLVNALRDFSLDAPCAWVRLFDTKSPAESFFAVDIEASVVRSGNGTELSFLTDSDVVATAALAKDYDWFEVRDHFRDLRRNYRYAVRLPFSFGYRPFHLLLVERVT